MPVVAGYITMKIRNMNGFRDGANLLWIALVQIDEDVQRHNDLLDVIRQDQSEISNIVSKRRKDFTKEFFEHLFVVTESYYDDAEKQTGVI